MSESPETIQQIQAYDVATVMQYRPETEGDLILFLDLDEHFAQARGWEHVGINSVMNVYINWAGMVIIDILQPYNPILHEEAFFQIQIKVNPYGEDEIFYIFAPTNENVDAERLNSYIEEFTERHVFHRIQDHLKKALERYLFFSGRNRVRVKQTRT